MKRPERTNEINTKETADRRHVDRFENLDWRKVVTPIKVDILEDLLVKLQYDRNETAFLVKGFTEGFLIGYKGPKMRQDTSRNIPFTIGDKFELWNKIMKEVKLGRYAGPFKDKPPFENFIHSPIGLVPKAGGKARLIFHLSYQFRNGNESVNYWTPKDMCSVKYKDLDHVIVNCLKLLRDLGDCMHTIFFAKTDLDSAFRQAPVQICNHQWLCMMAIDLLSGEKYFFIDLCLPFGASISCSHFQRISNALKHITEWKARRFNALSNYLDDFIFLTLSKITCNAFIKVFLEVCALVDFPISSEKKEYATELIVFLGMLLDGRRKRVAVPEAKRLKALHLIRIFIQKKKAKVKEIHQLAGLLNFLNRAIFPGRVFM